MPSLSLLPAWKAGIFSTLKEGAALTSRITRTGHVPATYQEGQLIEVTTVDVAHGGWCVARPDGRPVVFVRHTLPGETVTVEPVTGHPDRRHLVHVDRPSHERSRVCHGHI